MIDAFWGAILSSGNGASGASGACNTLQQNSQGYTPIGDEKIICNGINAPLAPLMPLGADPYDAEERHAIQKEGNEISNSPDKPILSLAEQAALVLDGYNGDKEQAAADLRVVAHNFALADYVEAGIVPLESPQPSLAESTTPMTPDRGFDDIAGFEGMTDLTATQHGAILHRLMNPTETAPSTTTSTSVPPEPRKPPQHVTCASCAEFEPGREPNSLGRCARTADGLPPISSRGYGCCFPHAPRTCQDFKENEPC